MRYAPELISPLKNGRCCRNCPRYPFKEFEFHGFLGSAAPSPSAGITISMAAG